MLAPLAQIRCFTPVWGRCCREQSGTGLESCTNMPLAPKVKRLFNQLSFVWPNKTEVSVDSQYTKLLWWHFQAQDTASEPRGSGSWWGPGDINSSAGSDTLGTVPSVRLLVREKAKPSS